jgi:hypothetical protein
MNYNVYSPLSQLASQRSNKSLWIKGKKKMKKIVSRQKSPGNRAKQECAALIKVVQAERMDDQKLANKRD